MIDYIRRFIKESRHEVVALKNIGIPLFIYQTVIRVFIITIFGIFYSFFVYWILRNPGEDYVFVTGFATLNYIHVDRLIIGIIFTILLILFSFFIETFGLVSLSRQYYMGKKVSLRRTLLDIVKYFRLTFKVQVLKYMYILSNIVVVSFLLYAIFLLLPNSIGYIVGFFLVLENCIIVVDKIIVYKDVGQRVFENKKNIAEVYNYTISSERKMRIFQFYLLKGVLVLFFVIVFPLVWLSVTWLICRMSENHEILTSLLLGLSSTVFLIIVIAASYWYLSFFALRSTRKYLEAHGQLARKFRPYSRHYFRRYWTLFVVFFVCVFGFQSVFFYNYFHSNIIPEKKYTLFAHRASMQKGTDNSIEALIYSIQNKIEFVEIDVQLSKEGVPIVFHDYTYFDGKQKKYVQNTPLAELKNFDLRSRQNSTSLDREPIPTLEEFLKMAKGNIKVNIEIKTTKNFENELAERVAQVVKKTQMQEHVLVTSLEYSILKKIREIIPNIQTGLVVTTYIGEVEEIEDMQVDWLMINDWYYLLNKDTFNSFEDKKIALWSFDAGFDSSDFLYEKKVQGVIVDDPVKIRKEIQEYNELPIGEKYYKQIEHLFLGGYGIF
ncbi:hypothetical protein CSB09_04585 [Candidatus Gracilibacteria bacterium]|nr:MAG: hypothetical protein CSB09_04585 [Candidatus Gracilibacteria bacterium]